LFGQEIPINKLLYSQIDFEFKLSSDGSYMASVKKFPNGYDILIVDIDKATVYQQIPLGEDNVYNLNWISANRITFEQGGLLYAINIDGTEKQQLLSMWKDDKPHTFYNYKQMLNYLQAVKLVNVLEDDFEHILVEKRGIDNYPVLYKLDIFTGEKTELENGESDEINEWLVDRKGNIRFGIKNEDDKVKFFKKNSKGKWESKNELNLDTDGKLFINQKLHFLDFDYNENIIYLASSINSARWYILRYDVEKKDVIDTVLTDKRYDIGNPVNEDTRLLFSDGDKKLIGIRYERDKPFTKWFDQKMITIQDSLDKSCPGYFSDIIDWNKDASVVVVKIFSDMDPGNIMIYDTRKNKYLFYSNFAPDLAKYQLSPTKIVNYKARDGYELEAYLNLPLNADTSSGCPFIIMPHGGPYVRDYWRYDPIVQFFTNQGYGVLRMNFRGSTGYGINHLLSGVKKISTLMISDIADGAKWAINNKLADSNNVFLYGHSYGGYAALESIIQYPDIYKGAVTIGAPTNIIKLIDYLDDEERSFSYEFWKTTIGNPDTENEFLKSISPIYNINKIHRPVFLFHGEKDEIVPVSQTEDFIDKAEDIDKKFEYKIIKDEDHSISENRNVEYILRKAIEFYKQNSTKK
jgi:dipeptidyl aminopeptidase/acylaminoacyl peptidase